MSLSLSSPTPVLRSAQTLSQFIDVIESLEPATSSGLWFRGQSKATRRLVPGTLREIETLTDGRGNPVKAGQKVRASGGTVGGPSPEAALAAFKRQALPFLDGRPANDFEWMFLAQHHGLKTRLLDWSTNALAALYFGASTAKRWGGDGVAACRAFEEGDEFNGEGFAVFVIDPGQINGKAQDRAYPIDVAADPETWDRYLDPVAHGLNAYLPLCVTAPHISPRVRAQSGAFTLHGSNVEPLDWYSELRPLITKIFIPFTATEAIQRSLRTAGVTAGFIYPGLDTIAADINADEARRYQKSMGR